MTTSYSRFGIPSNFFINRNDVNIKLIFDPDVSYFNSVIFNSDRKLNDYLILFDGCEPPLLNNIEKQIVDNHKFFDFVYTRNEKLYENISNCHQFVFGSCWILTDENGIETKFKKNYQNTFTTEKEFQLSFIKSSKSFLPGHNLRHQIVNTLVKKREFKLLFPHQLPLNEKKQLFQHSMFHLSIENSRYNNYITEKLIDCFMSFTLPIYWGAPNVGDIFNSKGILTFETEDELDEILNNLSQNDYLDRLPYMYENYNISYEKYAFFFERINQIILSL